LLLIEKGRGEKNKALPIPEKWSTSNVPKKETKKKRQHAFTWRKKGRGEKKGGWQI